MNEKTPKSASESVRESFGWEAKEVKPAAKKSVFSKEDRRVQTAMSKLFELAPRQASSRKQFVAPFKLPKVEDPTKPYLLAWDPDGIEVGKGCWRPVELKDCAET